MSWHHCMVSLMRSFIKRDTASWDRERSHQGTNLPYVDPCLLCLIMFQTDELNVILCHHTMTLHPFAFDHTMVKYNVRFCGSNTVPMWVVAVCNVRSEEIVIPCLQRLGPKNRDRDRWYWFTYTINWMLKLCICNPFWNWCLLLFEVAGVSTSYVHVPDNGDCRPCMEYV